ncbi:MAG: ABC transporter ATP-binding protein [Pseudomonadota bacterium]|uniref:ABC transporter ATP-binding protein n=1 Tax=Thermomonas sp. TaxID=1971895 RepID=UPI001AD4019F|nr:ABC transporter ATP-binding protein [Xanthomonadales bacterium]MBN8767775.1 ABC transporter ATP-binding protein [Stenotrophomonas sp.]
MSCEWAIAAHGIGKRYAAYARPWQRLLELLDGRARGQAFWALRELDLQVRGGESVGIIGRNGSGKSTLLQLLAGTLAPTTGTLRVQGRVAALLELGSGFNPEFTGVENAMLNAALHGLSRAQIERRLPDILAFADIGAFAQQPVRTYSSGMLVRLAFAVLAHVDADILLIDEALAVGDVFFAQKCMRFLREFQQRGTLLLVSHDTAAVSALCARALWLEQGRLRMDGPAREVGEAYLESQIAAREGAPEGRPRPAAASSAQVATECDVREELLLRSALRNDIQVPVFDPARDVGFGEGSARLRDVALRDAQGRRLTTVVGGERVTLEIVAEALAPIAAPIIGFYLKDRLGQLLFGDNTYLTTAGAPLHVPAGARYRARFTFRMPRLQAGDYAFAIGLARGTQAEHIVQWWSHAALALHAEGQGLPTGILGLPMLDIALEPLDG